MQPVRLRRLDSVRWFFLFTFLVIACFSHALLAATKVINDADNGGSVQLKAGDQLEVRLKSNPTTGFMWYVEKESTPLLKLVHQSQTEAPAPEAGKPIMVGQPIFQVFIFEPRRSGDGTLLLHYVRSWEKPAPDDEQFQIHVVIE
jgi:inhibitor of cysteine peptidase